LQEYRKSNRYLLGWMSLFKKKKICTIFRFLWFLVEETKDWKPADKSSYNLRRNQSVQVVIGINTSIRCMWKKGWLSLWRTFVIWSHQWEYDMTQKQIRMVINQGRNSIKSWYTYEKVVNQIKRQIKNFFIELVTCSCSPLHVQHPSFALML
jgi:hypothetical protein